MTEDNGISRVRIIVFYTLALCAVIAMMSFFSSWRLKPSEEIITVDSNQTKPVSLTTVRPVSVLPEPDRDIETAGDRVAAAVIYLKRQQNEPALNALDQATAATQRAIDRKPDQNTIHDQLLATNREIEAAKVLIRSGRIGTATTELKEIDQKLESVSY